MFFKKTDFLKEGLLQLSRSESLGANKRQRLEAGGVEPLQVIYKTRDKSHLQDLMLKRQKATLIPSQVLGR